MPDGLSRRRIITSAAGTLLAGGALSYGQTSNTVAELDVPENSDGLYEELIAATEAMFETTRRLHSILESVRVVLVDHNEWDAGRERLRTSEYDELGEEFVTARSRTEELGEAVRSSDLRNTISEYLVLLTDTVNRIEERRELIEDTIVSGREGRDEDAQRQLETVVELERRAEEMITEAGEAFQEIQEQGRALAVETHESESAGSEVDVGKRSRRGFLTNDPDAMTTPDSLLNDPIMLTVTGFVLSVVGILYQMVSS